VADVWEEIGWTDPDKRNEAIDRLLERLRKTPAVPEHEVSSRSRIGGGHVPGRPVRATPSANELRIIECLSHGMTVGMAADSLGVSFYTAQSQMMNARTVLAAKNQAHAVAIALRRGMID
jgi:DNA-binding NarL/FixJ family response regulator